MRLDMQMTRQTKVALAGLLILLGILVGWGLILKYSDPARQPAQGVLDEDGGPPLDPLMVEALRNRDYPGGQVAVTQRLGDQGGYSREVISYPSDGLTLYALAAIPASAPPAGGYPVIILNHGYIPAAQYRTTGGDYATFIAYYAQQGYVVIKPDYRGHGQSQGSARGGHFSADYTIDVLNLVGSLKTYPVVNPSRVGMIGHSLGGHVTLRAIVVSKAIRASVLMAGVVGTADDLVHGWNDWRMARGISRGPIPSGATSSRQQFVSKYGDPREGNAFWHKVMAINYVGGVAGPVQIHHGTQDESVPPFMSQHLAEALKKAGRPYELFIYEGGDHNFTGSARALFLSRTLALFNQTL